MRPQILLLPFFCIALLFSSCVEETPTIISITVKNEAGEIQPNVLVYQFEKPSTEVLGSNPTNANKSNYTNKQGVAEFAIDVFESGEGSSETKLYFTVLQKSGQSFTLSGTKEVKFKEGDLKSEILVIK